MKKKMYYNMRVMTLHRQLTELQNRMSHVKDDYLATPNERLQTLAFLLKEVHLLPFQATNINYLSKIYIHGMFGQLSNT